MMLNFDKYHLVEFLENPTLYEIQKHIKTYTNYLVMKYTLLR